jgi:hypothetical protein
VGAADFLMQALRLNSLNSRIAADWRLNVCVYI